MIVSLLLLYLLIVNASALDHDGWEFHGGRRLKPKHGLNAATADTAPIENNNLRFDRTAKPESMTIVTNDEAPPAASSFFSLSSTSSDRFSLQQELLLLPDRYSVLSFEPKSEIEADDSSSFWGRLYIDGFPSSIQYFRGHFGKAPYFHRYKLVLADPLNMCNETFGLPGQPVLHNMDAIDDMTVIVTMRGGCTFGDKANVAYHDAGAAGILFINKEEGIIHPTSVEARDINMSTLMITNHDGDHLISALRRVASLNARFVPMACREGSSSNYCTPMHSDDKRFVESLNYTGKLFSEDGEEFDYVQGEFGAWLDPHTEWNIIMPSDIGGDAHCCDTTRFETNVASNTASTALLCLRGNCDFVTKAESAAEAGAGMLIVSSYNNTFQRMGCDPPIRGRLIDVVTIMVGQDSYKRIAGKKPKISMNQQAGTCEDETLN